MSKGTRRVLIIDDESTIRAALRRYFVRRGWEVEEAEDGRSALALIEADAERYDVVVSDLRMPGFSGIDLHDRLARDRPGMLRRMVFSTGDVASREAAGFVQRTTCPVLQKPFELRMLDELVARLAEGAPV
jgi:DNA-binding NtrC family response regulator